MIFALSFTGLHFEFSPDEWKNKHGYSCLYELCFPVTSDQCRAPDRSDWKKDLPIDRDVTFCAAVVTTQERTTGNTFQLSKWKEGTLSRVVMQAALKSKGHSTGWTILMYYIIIVSIWRLALTSRSFVIIPRLSESYITARHTTKSWLIIELIEVS